MTKRLTIFFAILFLGMATANAQTANAATTSTNQNNKKMKTFLIERDIPGAGDLTPEQLKGISQKSCSVLNQMGPSIEWVQSYVAGNKIYCVYRAESAELIKEHAQKGGFPANVITEVANIISPATAKN